MGTPQQNQDQKKQKQTQSEKERDGRMDRTKQQNEEKESTSDSQPESGEQSEDPAGRRKPDQKSDKEAAAANESGAPPWMAKLPPEVRDYFSGGHFEKIPSTYRYLIDHYNRWLNKKRAKKVR